jgi:hypothetical protein
LGIPDVFVEHGPPSLLRAKYGIDEDGIFRAVIEMLEEEKWFSLHPDRDKSCVRRALPDSK